MLLGTMVPASAQEPALGARVAHVEASALHMYDCRLRLDLRNDLGLSLLALAATLRLHDADGTVLATVPFETTGVADGTERREELAFKLDVEGGLRPTDQYALVGQCDILDSAALVLHACLEAGGGDVFDLCASGLVASAGGSLPMRFEARPERDAFIRFEPPPAAVERAAMADRLALGGQGLTLSGITEALARRWSLPDDRTGLLVVTVDPEGPAAARGLRPGDVVVEIDQQEVTDPAAAVALLADARRAGRSSLLFLVDRADGHHFVVLPAR